MIKEISIKIKDLKSRYKVMNFLLGFTMTVIVGCSSSSSSGSNTESSIILDSALMMPDFTIATINDSASFNSKDINKEGLILLKYFSPDCNHCQDEAKMYVSKKDSLQNIKTIWVAGDWATLKKAKEFTEIYKLGLLDPIVVGKDHTYDLGSYYKITGVPFAAVYRDNQLLKEYRGDLDFSELIAINNGEFVPDSVSIDNQIE